MKTLRKVSVRERASQSRATHRMTLFQDKAGGIQNSQRKGASEDPSVTKISTEALVCKPELSAGEVGERMWLSDIVLNVRWQDR